MINMKTIMKFFYRCNRRFIRYMTFCWCLFALAMFLVKIIFNNSYVSSSTFMAFISSMITIAAIIPFISQYATFPYSISLGMTRKDFVKGTIAFNIISLIVMELIINIIFITGRITSVIVTMPGIGNAYVRILYFGFAAGISCIFTFLAAIFYRFGFVNGISSILLLLSPLMLFRNRIFEYISWNKWGFEISSFVFLLIGLIFALLSWLVIKKAEVRV